ncbi:MAG: transpeptidase family protein, partial [Chitinophagaceae bacterium]|nr:transpeptidase family protein [Chitinophagaceae bacterium]
WRSEAKKQQQRFIETDADRGTIYSEDENMLSTSIPFFDIYIDFGAEGLRDKNGKRFKENVDSLSMSLAALFKDRTTAEYKKELQNQYRSKNRYYLLKRNISFQEYKVLRNCPLVRQGKNKSGFIAEVKNKRLNPYGLLANRTIGLSRDFIDSDGKVKNLNVGLEHTYDSILRGETGKKLVRYIAGGVYVPVEGYEIEPEQGKDVVTTLDVNVQDIAETALLRMMEGNECEHGTCIVMEVKTGKIKAIANLGRTPEGTYWEDLNYAIRASEPGSTFKLATMLALLEDGYATLNSKVDLEKGVWQVSRRTVYDSERHNKNEVTLKQAFEHSSNVGMAKMVWSNYSKDPMKYISHLQKLRLNRLSGIDLAGETSPIVKTPKSKTWSATSLPWMSFGYEVLVSPLQTLMLYNAVANEGKMMKPYLVNEIRQGGITVKKNSPEVLEEAICSERTLNQLKQSLVGVCQEAEGTGYKLFLGSPYQVAGKTGTALVANGRRGYADHIYQSSFAGYFPANDPQYSIIVVIKNKPFAKLFYGASVAGPVFKEIADKLFAIKAETPFVDSVKNDSIRVDYVKLVNTNSESVKTLQDTMKNNMPNVKGMGLKDVLYLLENKDLKVLAKGKGKVTSQSILPGSALSKGQTVIVELN